MKDFTVASTTDPLEAVQAAAGMAEMPEPPEGEELEQPSETPLSPEEPPAPAPDEGKPETTPKKGEKDYRWAKRVDKLTEEVYARDAEIEQLRQQLQKVDASKETLQQPPGKPVRASFANDEDFVEAVAEWKYAQKEEQRQLQQQQANKASAKAQFKRAAAEFSQVHPDYDNVIGSIVIRQDVGAAMEDIIPELPNGVEAAYYIGQNPDIVDELNQMPLGIAIARIGAIAASFSARNTRPSPKPASRIPAPITPVSGGSSRVAQDPGEMDYQAYRTYRGDRPTGRR